MKPYPPESIEFCLQLYLKFNGQQFDRIEAEMQRRWPTWQKKNLLDYGNRQGWITRYGWKDALQAKLAASAKAGLTGAEALYLDIREQRESLSLKIKTATPKPDRDLIYQHRDYCRLEIEALAKLTEARNRLADFVIFWEALLEWLPTISRKAWRELVDVSDQVLEQANKLYGQKEN